MFDIVGKLRTFAEAKGWIFIYGNDQYANYHATMGDLDKLVLVVDLNGSPVYSKEGSIEDMVFTGGIMLGQKREAESETESSLDETMIQKYDRRLKYLTETLFISLGDFGCANGYSITQLNARFDINKFDESMDFIAATITLSTQ